MYTKGIALARNELKSLSHTYIIEKRVTQCSNLKDTIKSAKQLLFKPWDISLICNSSEVFRWFELSQFKCFVHRSTWIEIHMSTVCNHIEIHCEMYLRLLNLNELFSVCSVSCDQLDSWFIVGICLYSLIYRKFLTTSLFPSFSFIFAVKT